MSDDRERGIQAYWRHTYETWDRADNARRLELDFQTTRSGLEAARLGREIEASQQREREARLERERKERSIRLEESIETFRRQKERALEAIGSYATTAEWANAQAEWRHELEPIDPCRPEAKSALDGLLVKVRAFKSGFLEGAFGLAKSPRWLEDGLVSPVDEGTPSAATGVGAALEAMKRSTGLVPPRLVPTTPIPLLPDDPNTRILGRRRSFRSSLEGRILDRRRSFQSSLEEIEASLKPLVALWGAVQTRKRELAD